MDSAIVIHNCSYNMLNRIVVLVGMFASSVVDHGFQPRSDQAKDSKIGFCCFSATYAALRSKSKNW